MLQFKSSPRETSPGTLTASLASTPDTFPRSPDFHSHPSPHQGNMLTLSSNWSLSELGWTSKKAKTSLNFPFPPFLTTRPVFRSDGKGIWRGQAAELCRGRTLSPHVHPGRQGISWASSGTSRGPETHHNNSLSQQRAADKPKALRGGSPLKNI